MGAASSNGKGARRFQPTIPKTPSGKQFRFRPILMERAVNIADFEGLVFEGQSRPMIFTKRGWTGILDLSPMNVLCELVCEFYTQVADVARGSTSWDITVRGLRVTINPNEISTFLHLPRSENYQGVPEDTATNFDGVYQAPTGLNGPSTDDCHKDLLPFFQELRLIVSTNVYPRRNTASLTFQDGDFLLRIARGSLIDLPKLIFRIIQREAQSINFTDVFVRLHNGNLDR